MNRLLGRAVAVVVLFALGCALFPTGPPLPDGAVVMAALPQYAPWWRLAERCSGLSGDPAAVSWYSVPGADILRGTEYQGVYYPASRRIVLAGRHLSDGPIVRHEILHALLAVGGHPATYFQQRCNGMVSCGAQCLAEGGPLPVVDSSGPAVRVSDIYVTARADSTAPSVSRDSGWVALTVEVRNPYSYAVRLRLAPVPWDDGLAITYGHQDRICDRDGIDSHAYDWITGTTIVLGPGKVQRRVFDIHSWSDCTMMQPFFNGDTLPDIRIQREP